MLRRDLNCLNKLEFSADQIPLASHGMKAFILCRQGVLLFSAIIHVPKSTISPNIHQLNCKAQQHFQLLRAQKLTLLKEEKSVLQTLPGSRREFQCEVLLRASSARRRAADSLHRLEL